MFVAPSSTRSPGALTLGPSAAAVEHGRPGHAVDHIPRLEQVRNTPALVDRDTHSHVARIQASSSADAQLVLVYEQGRTRDRALGEIHRRDLARKLLQVPHRAAGNVHPAAFTNDELLLLDRFVGTFARLHAAPFDDDDRLDFVVTEGPILYSTYVAEYQESGDGAYGDGAYQDHCSSRTHSDLVSPSCCCVSAVDPGGGDVSSHRRDSSGREPASLPM